MMLALAAGQLRAQTKTAYAVYCENSKELHFLCSDDAELSSVVIGGKTVTLTFEGDNTNAWKGEDVTDTKTYGEPDWNSKCSEATKVVFESSFADAVVTSCHAWFANFSALKTVTGLEYLKTSNVTDMSRMFSTCEKLTSLDLSKFGTSNVTNMGSMFSNCFELTSLDLSSFDTSNVTDMSSMFSCCSALKTLDLSSFNIAQKGSCGMDNMFHMCGSLTSIVFGQLNTSGVTMNNMFNECHNLKFLDLSKAKGDKIPDMIGTLPENTYPVIFVPSGITLTVDRKNVISPTDGKCDNLEIDADNLPSLSFPYNFTAENIKFNRGFVAGQPHTLYLPFAMDAKKYGTFYTFTKYDETSQKVIFSKIPEGKTTANTPYLFVPNETTANANRIVIEGGNIDVEATTEVEVTEQTENLIGVYKKHTFDDTNKANCYGWTANGEFRKAGSGASVGACRAYLKLAAAGGSTAPARLSIQLGDGTTGITAVKGGAYGDSDAPMYNLQGQRVDKSYRGVVIKNGKKMIIK